MKGQEGGGGCDGPGLFDAASFPCPTLGGAPLYEGTLGSISSWVLTRRFERSLYTKVTFQDLF